MLLGHGIFQACRSLANMSLANMSNSPTNSNNSPDNGLNAGGGGQFHTTCWSMVLSLGEDDSENSAALDQLCRQYWYPIYAFARRHGTDPDTAADLTQAFFCTVLEHDVLAKASPERGRFRTFLLACFKNFQRNEHRRETSRKRGGNVKTFSIDAELGESRYQHEPSHDETPEKLFERRWAMQLLDQALARLDDEFACAGRHELYVALKPFLSGTPATSSYREVSEQFLMSPTAIKVTMHRLRQRYRELLQDEVRQTVASADEVETELARLFESFS
jgi:RNA polymerase sigma-70 factor (ECF subfamily)